MSGVAYVDKREFLRIAHDLACAQDRVRALEKDNADVAKINIDLIKVNRELEAKLRETEIRLRMYGGHTANCAYHLSHYRGPVSQCDCMWTDLIPAVFAENRFGTCPKCGQPITSFHNINGCNAP